MVRDVNLVFNDRREYKNGNTLVVNLVFNDRREYKNGNTLVVNLVFNDRREYKNGNTLVVNLVFNDRREYKNGNTLVVNLVKKAEAWQWSSVWRREQGTEKQKKLLSLWPTPIPKDYLKILNQPLATAEEETPEHSEEKSIP